MKAAAERNGNRFTDEFRQQVLAQFKNSELPARLRVKALSKEHGLGEGTLRYWLAKSQATQPKKRAKSTAIVIQPTPVRTVPVNEGQNTALLLLRAVQKNLNHKRPSELSTDELTTLLALRNLEGKGRAHE